MSNRIKQIIADSKTINFFKNFNKKILLFFFNSKTYNFFVKINSFFKKEIAENAGNSTILKWVRKAYKSITLKDAGIFIILAVLFNTFAMLILRKEIDIFSIFARVFFLILGVVLIYRGWGDIG